MENISWLVQQDMERFLSDTDIVYLPSCMLCYLHKYVYMYRVLDRKGPKGIYYCSKNMGVYVYQINFGANNALKFPNQLKQQDL